MALINCPECNKEVSDKAEVCIHCGFPLIEKSKQEEKNEKIIVTHFRKSKVKRYNRWLLETTREENPSLPVGLFSKGDEVSLLDKDLNEICKRRLDTYANLKIAKEVFSFGFDNMEDYIIQKTEAISKTLSSNQSILSNKDENPNLVKCPKCGSTQIQAVPRKWSLATGLLTNQVDRVCMNCKHKF